MAHISDLFPELYTLITFLVISSGDIRDWATISATCKKFKDAGTEPDILRAVKFQDLVDIGHCEQHLHINGLLSKGVQVGNMNAEYTMAKIILGGEAPLWKTISENDLTAISIKCAITPPLSERHGIAKPLSTNNTADHSYVLFSSEDQPHLREPCVRLHYSRLIRSFITLVNSYDSMIIRRLRDFIKFFVGFHKYSESEIENSITDLYVYGQLMILYTGSRGREIPRIFLKTIRRELSPDNFICYKDQFIKAFDKLIQEDASSY